MKTLFPFLIMAFFVILPFALEMSDPENKLRKPAFEGMCFRDRSAQQTVFKIVKIDKQEVWAIFNEEKYKKMEPFKILYMKKGYIQVKC